LDERAKLMETAYWLQRARASIENALIAKTAEARLIHYELAGRYSVKAANPVGVIPTAVRS
jgi:hypothetical protein